MQRQPRKHVSRTHTHTQPCKGPLFGTTRKVKPIWILLKQEIASGSGISWAICKSAPRSRQIAMPVPHHSSFYRPDALPAAQPTTSKHVSRNLPEISCGIRPTSRRCASDVYLRHSEIGRVQIGLAGDVLQLVVHSSRADERGRTEPLTGAPVQSEQISTGLTRTRRTDHMHHTTAATACPHRNSHIHNIKHTSGVI